METKFELLIRLPSGLSARFPLPENPIRIGRGASSEISLPDHHLSRIHAVVRKEEDAYLLEDQGSRNGTFVNERRVRGSTALRPGDRISMGGCSLVFQQAHEDRSSGDEEGETFEASALMDEAPSGLTKDLVAVAPVMREVVATAVKASGHDVPVLLLGESGTGKEVIARLIHKASPRRSGRFVAVNCPALAPTLVESELFGVEKGVATGVDARKGKFEQAQGGTLFLDEIGDIEPHIQAKLLRIIEESTLIRVGGTRAIPLDLRIIAATNRDLKKDMEEGRFREDLFYRINAVVIPIPPLRERREDIVPLCRHFLARFGGGGVTLSPEATAALESYAFKGNVRELLQWVRRAVILRTGDVIGLEDLPEEMRGEGTSQRADRIYRAIVDEGGDFWALVRKPYLARDLTREEARHIIARGLAESDGNVRVLSELFGIKENYKKLLNFLRNQKLYDGKKK